MTKKNYKEHAQHTSLLAPYKYYPSGVPVLSPFFSPHWHSEFEINFILSGSAAFTCDGESFTAHEGDIFIFLPGQIHSIDPIENEKSFYDTLLFKAETLGPAEERGYLQIMNPLLDGLFKVKSPISREDPNYEALRNAIEAVFVSAKANTAPMDFLLKSDLLRFFYLLYANNYIYSQQIPLSRYSDIIRPALLYIKEHYAEEISVDELASLIPLSKSYFMSCFKKATGVSAITYTTLVRIQQVSQMLLKTDKSVTQIASECGFHNLANFNRQFKKNTGYTPVDYRNKFTQSH